jgi:hypothetical protein
MAVATILVAADINDVCDYYHYNDGLKYIRDYNNLPSGFYCDFLY